MPIRASDPQLPSGPVFPQGKGRGQPTFLCMQPLHTCAFPDLLPSSRPWDLLPTCTCLQQGVRKSAAPPLQCLGTLDKEMHKEAAPPPSPGLPVVCVPSHSSRSSRSQTPAVRLVRWAQGCPGAGERGGCQDRAWAHGHPVPILHSGWHGGPLARGRLDLLLNFLCVITAGRRGSGHAVHQGSLGGLRGLWVRDKGEWVPGVNADTRAEGQAAMRIFAGPWSTLDALEEGILEARAGVARQSRMCAVSKRLCGPGTSFTQPPFTAHLLCAGPSSGHVDRGMQTRLPYSPAVGDSAVKPRDDGRVKNRPDPA